MTEHASAWDLTCAAVDAAAKIYSPGALEWARRIDRPVIADPVIDASLWPAGAEEMRRRLLAWYREHESLSIAHRVAQQDLREMRYR